MNVNCLIFLSFYSKIAAYKVCSDRKYLSRKTLGFEGKQHVTYCAAASLDIYITCIHCIYLYVTCIYCIYLYITCIYCIYLYITCMYILYILIRYMYILTLKDIGSSFLQWYDSWTTNDVFCHWTNKKNNKNPCMLFWSRWLERKKNFLCID